MRFRNVTFVAVLLAAPLMLAGCGQESRNVLAPEVATQTLSANEAAVGTQAGKPDPTGDASRYPKMGIARTMFVHASPDAPAVDVLVDRYRVARGLAFPENSGYEYLRAGDRRVRVNVAGTQTTVIDATLNLVPRRNYSVFAVNRVASIEPLVTEDDLSRPASGKAHVRFIHLSPDAPAVDVAIAGGPVVFANKSFKEYTPFTPVPAGRYDLEVRVAGTSTVALSLPGIQFKEGGIYTVFARGFLNGAGAQALGAQIIKNAGGRGAHDNDDEDDDRAASAVVR
jgi:hypothetical protein